VQFRVSDGWDGGGRSRLPLMRLRSDSFDPTATSGARQFAYCDGQEARERYRGAREDSEARALDHLEVIQFGYVLRANLGKQFYGRANATYAPGILPADAGWPSVGCACVEVRAAAQKTTYCRPACS
jgi:hypothetical protein